MVSIDYCTKRRQVHGWLRLPEKSNNETIEKKYVRLSIANEKFFPVVQEALEIFSNDINDSNLEYQSTTKNAIEICDEQ